jgi:hypothetical protein
MVSLANPWTILSTRPRPSHSACRASRVSASAEIADSLGLSLSTVKGHLRNAYRQLGVENRRQAVAVLDCEGPVANN